jgi:hypothetical protein
MVEPDPEAQLIVIVTTYEVTCPFERRNAVKPL